MKKRRFIKRGVMALAVVLAVAVSSLGIAQAVPLRVATIGAPGSAVWNTEVQSKLVSTGLFLTVDAINAAITTPTLAQLQTYDSVLVYSDTSFSHSTQLGNNLADYVDSGGGVVVATFAFNVSPLGGRWGTGGYNPIQVAGQTSGIGLSLGPISDPSHPIMAGVSSFNGGSSSYHNTGALNPNANLIASWSNGDPLVGVLNTFNAPIVGLNFYPPSSDSRGDFWNANTDGALLLGNSLTFAAGNVPAPVPEPGTWLLMGTGLVGLLGYGWRRRNA